MAVIGVYAVLLILLSVPVIHCETQEITFDTKYTSNNRSQRDIQVMVGSRVVLICDCNNTNPCNRTDWKKDYMNLVYGNCTHSTETIYSKGLKNNINFKCEKHNRLTFESIQPTDEGIWYCYHIIENVISNYSEIINITIQPTKTTNRDKTTRRSSTKKKTSKTAETSTLSTLSAAHSSAQPSTTQESYLFIIIGLVTGGFVVVTVIAVILAATRRKQTKGKSQPGQNTGRHYLDDDDNLGEYAQIGKPTQPQEAAVSENNVLYESCDGNQEPTASITISSVIDCGGDVYSVVQKTMKKTDAESESSKQTTNDAAGDVYSVVQKPVKSQTEVTDSTCGRTPITDDVTDVYSVVQKPVRL